MPHIHTKPGEHDHTASAFVIRKGLGEPVLLIHRHKKLGVYLQFGGHIETTETPWQAVTHELLEESGYSMRQLRLLQPKERLKKTTNAVLHPVSIYHNTHKFDESHFHTDVAYAFVTDSDPEHSIGESESKAVRMVTRQELADMPADEIYESAREAGLFVFDVCLGNWEEVDPEEFSTF